MQLSKKCDHLNYMANEKPLYYKLFRYQIEKKILSHPVCF